tara:strand:- start:2 stop:1333 length:1332 start_codon:yes stop_codon:yes gene_type:complete
MATRNRVIYQSEAVYCSQDVVFSGVQTGYRDNADLDRVQSANYSFNISRTDVNQFGQLGAIDRIITESPSVSFDSSYLLANFGNEYKLGFFVTQSGDIGPFKSCITNLVDSTSNAYQKNYYILNAKEGKDADETSYIPTSTTSGNYESLIGIGNAGITSYSVEAAVGGFPTVSFSAEGLNMNFYGGNGGTGLNCGTFASTNGTTNPIGPNNKRRTPFYISGKNPAINPIDGKRYETTTRLPSPTGSVSTTAAGSVSVLRPGDLRLFISRQPTLGGPDAVANAALTTNMGKPDYAGADIADAHIQSFNLGFDLSRSPIEQLGSKFAYARLVDFPVTVSLGIDAVVSDLTTGSLAEILDCDEKFDARIQLGAPDCGVNNQDAEERQRHAAANYIVKGIKLDSQSFSLGMGDNKTVSLSFSTQIGGPEQSGHGVFMSGYYLADTID